LKERERGRERFRRREGEKTENFGMRRRERYICEDRKRKRGE